MYGSYSHARAVKEFEERHGTETAVIGRRSASGSFISEYYLYADGAKRSIDNFDFWEPPTDQRELTRLQTMFYEQRMEEAADAVEDLADELKREAQAGVYNDDKLQELKRRKRRLLVRRRERDAFMRQFEPTQEQLEARDRAEAERQRQHTEFVQAIEAAEEDVISE